ncbi:hypothetical protein MCELHM10_03420 [Paracoccaceae bacterium]
MTATDRAELIAELQRYVPKLTVGHGLERREVYLHPRKARGADQIVASVALFRLMEEVEAQRDPKDRILGDAIEIAKQVLRTDLGVDEYHGLLATYLQKLPDGRFKQIDISGQAEDDAVGHPTILWGRRPENHGELQQRYILGEVGVTFGSRSIQTLAGFWKLGSFELNSPADHAVSILDAALRIDIMATQSFEPKGIEGKVDSKVWKLVESAFEIGRHFDALTKKKVESLAQQKLEHTEKNRKNASLGGQGKKGRSRREELNRLAVASKNFFEKRLDGVTEVLLFIEKRQAIAQAMKLTEQYDKDRSPEEKLFTHRGERLSKHWYDGWWEDFISQQKIFQ